MSRKKKLIVTAILLVSLVGLLTPGVLAVYTSSQSVGANAFQTGTVSLTTAPTTALVTFANMAPGDQVTNPITITNAGTLDLRYAITSTTTENTLAGQLVLTIKSGVATCTNAGFGGSGTVLYTGILGSNPGPLNVVGNPSQGYHATPGGGDRTLAASANEPLCFNVALPLATGNAFASLSTTATFGFQSEQTKNNP